MRSSIVLALVLVCGCPGPSTTDAGTGGGNATGGGNTAGGSSGGGTAGSTGGGTAGSTGGGTGGSTGGGTGGSTGGGSGGSTGGGTGGGTVVDAGNIPINQLCTEYLDAVCSYYVYCGAFENKASCITVNVDRFNPWFASACYLDEKLAVAGGRAAYDGRAAASCFNSVRTATSCLALNYPDCNNILRGLVTDGGCARSFECDPNSYCDSSLAMCPGRCQGKKPGGADAGADEECQTGYYDYDGHCRLYALTNFSCAPVGTSMNRQQCRPGEAFCNPANNTCTALGTAGSVCADDNNCAFPNRCFGMRCGLPSGLGQLCGYGVAGGPAQGCKFDLACEGGIRPDGGTCAPLFPIDAGCISPFECAGNAVCPGVQFGALPDGGFVSWGRCSPPLPSGSPCATELSNVCDLGTAYCRADAGCTLRRPVGTSAACGAPDDCTPPETCLAGTCRRAQCVVP